MAQNNQPQFANSEEIQEKYVTSNALYIRNNGLVNNISERNHLYSAMKAKNLIQTIQGMVETRVPIAGQQNRSYRRFDEYIEVPVKPAKGITVATFVPVSVGANIMLSQTQILDASGSENQVPLIKAHMKILMETIANEFSYDLYSAGTERYQINGLQTFLKTTGGGRYAGISPDEVDRWRHPVEQLPAGYDYDDIMAAVDNVFIGANWGSTVNIGLFSVDLFTKILKGHRDKGQVQMKQKGSIFEGATSFDYNGCEITYDHNANFGKTAQRGYLLNTNHIFLKSFRDANWTVDRPDAGPTTFAKISRVHWRGFMGTDLVKAHGLIYR